MDGLFSLLDGSLSDISTSDEDESDQSVQKDEEEKEVDALPASDYANAVKSVVACADAASKSTAIASGPSEVFVEQQTPASHPASGSEQINPVITTVTNAIAPLRPVVDLSKVHKSKVTDDCNIETPLPADSVETVPVCL